MEELNFDCSNLDVLPDLEFEMDGHKFSLPPSAYVAKLDGELPDDIKKVVPGVKKGSHQCELMIIDTGSMGHEMWILGMPWFRKYYTVFSLGTMPSDRAFYIAHHGEEVCEPEEQATKRTAAAQKLRTLQANKLLLPKMRRARTLSKHREAVDSLMEASGPKAPNATSPAVR